MANRHWSGFGLHPVLGYGILLTGFLLFSEYFFSKITFAAWICVFTAWVCTLKLSEQKRNDFLKCCFDNKTCMKIRLLENTLIAIPFILLLVYKLIFVPLLILIPLVSLMAFVKLKTISSKTLPTPFYKKPFEFTVGSRNAFYVLGIVYFLVFMAVLSHNFNLGIAALALLFFTVFSFYQSPENDYFVWSFSLSPHYFLMEKVKTAFLFTTLLSLPAIIPLSLFFKGELQALLFFQGVGYCFLITIILAKYAAYPSTLHLPQVILIGISFYFPPLLLGIIPLFYFQSVKKLNIFLQ